MSYETEEVEEIISVREEQIKELINQFMSGEKALSFSSLKAFAESPAAFIQYQLREKKTTPAMMWGTLIHCLTLEPDNFGHIYAVLDDTEKCEEIGGKMPRATTKYKDWKSEFISKNEGKQVITIDFFDRAATVVNNITSNRAAAPLLEMCTEREKYVEWTFENIKFRGFIDAKTPVGGTGPKAIIDLKTCANASPEKFRRDIISSKYYLQGTMYNKACEDDTEYAPYHIIAADQNGGVSVHRLEPPLIEYGEKEYKRLVDAFNKCLLTDSFNQSYDFWANNKSGIYSAPLPSWMA